MDETLEKTDNYFLDTEFFDPPEPGFSLDFISVGLVSHHGVDFYGVWNEVSDAKYRGEWIFDNVIAKLPPQRERLSLAQIRDGLLGVFSRADRVDIWAHNGSYDHFSLARIFGGQLRFREALCKTHGIERVTFRDTKELLIGLSAEFRMPIQDDATKHISIHDAHQERAVFDAVLQGGMVRPIIAKLPNAEISHTP